MHPHLLPIAWDDDSQKIVGAVLLAFFAINSAFTSRSRTFFHVLEMLCAQVSGRG